MDMKAPRTAPTALVTLFAASAVDIDDGGMAPIVVVGVSVGVGEGVGEAVMTEGLHCELPGAAPMPEGHAAQPELPGPLNVSAEQSKQESAPEAANEPAEHATHEPAFSAEPAAHDCVRRAPGYDTTGLADLPARTRPAASLTINTGGEVRAPDGPGWRFLGIEAAKTLKSSFESCSSSAYHGKPRPELER